jgi:hypothetical protein
MKTKVLLAAPVRDRAWVLPQFIQHLQAQNLTNVQLDTLFLANNCQDQTVSLLKEANLRVIEKNHLSTRTAGSLRGQYSFSHLAYLRNLLVQAFLETDNEYFFSVDTDILLPSSGLQTLLAHKKNICSMLLCNQLTGEPCKRAHNIMKWNETHQKFQHLLQWEEGEILEVDLTGAVYLIHRNVLEDGVRYSYHGQGEDAAFCTAAKQKGYHLYCDTSLRPVHMMAPGVAVRAGC